MADGQRLPFVDGVLILYDVTNPASISKLPESLGEWKLSPVVCLICCYVSLFLFNFLS